MVFNQIRRLFITLDATDKATRKLKQVDRAADDVSATVADASQRLKFLRRRLVAAGFGATILTGAIAQMVQQFAQVDRTFARVAATSGATAEQMSMIRAEARRIGAQMPVRLQEAANAFKQLSFAGFSVQEQMAAAADVTELAVAGGMKMSEAARIAASTLRAFSLEAKQVGQVTNALAQTFTNSATNLNELRDALQFVQSSASAAGQSVNETVAALGTLADVGLRASKAGTALERMFVKLAERTNKTQEAMNRLGISMDQLTDSEGDFRDLNEIVQILGNNMDSLQGNAEELRAMQEIFGARGARAAIQLVRNQDKLITKIGNNARAQIEAIFRTLDQKTQEELDRMSTTLGFQIEPDMSTEQIVNQLKQQVRDGASQEDIQTRLQIGLGLEEQTAEIFARDLMTESADDIARSLDNVTAAGDIAQEVMKSLGGQIDYVLGSLDSLNAKLVVGMMPVLNTFFFIVKGILDTLNSSPKVVKALGLALSALAGTLLLLTAHYAAAAAKTWLFIQAQQGNYGALILTNSATAIQNTLLAIYQGNVSMAAAKTWFMNTALVQYAVAAWGAASGMIGLNAAIEWFESMTLIGQLLSIVVGLVLLTGTALAAADAFMITGDNAEETSGFIAALTKAVNWLLTPIYFLIDALDFLARLLIQITTIGIDWAFQAFGDAAQYLLEQIREIPIVGDAIANTAETMFSNIDPLVDLFKLLGIAVLTVINPYLGAAGAAVWLAEKFGLLDDVVSALAWAWDRLGLAIGDALRLLIGLGIKAVDIFMQFGGTELIAFFEALWDVIVATGEVLAALGEVLLAVGGVLWELGADIAGPIIDAFVQLGRIVAGVLVEAFEMLMDFLEPVITFIEGMVARVVEILEPWHEEIILIAKLLGILGAVAAGIVGGPIAALIGVVAVLMTYGEELAGILSDLADWLSNAADNISGLADAISNINLDPIDVLKAAVAPFVALGLAIKKLGEFIYDGLVAGFNVAMDAVTAFVGFVTDMFPLATQSIMVAIQGIINFASSLWNFVTSLIDVLVTVGSILADIAVIVEKVVAAIATIGAVISLAVLQGLADIFVAIGEAIAEWAAPYIRELIGLLEWLAGGILYGLKVALLAVIAPFYALYKGAVMLYDILAGLAQEAIAVATEKLNELAQALEPYLTAAIEGAVTVLKALVAVFWAGLDALRKFVDGLLAAPGMIVGVFANIGSMVLDGLTGILDGLDNFLSGIESWLSDVASMTVGEMISAFASAGSAAVDALAGGIQAGIDAAIDAITGVVQTIRDFLPFSPAKRGPLSDLPSAGEALVKTLGAGIKAAVGLITAPMDILVGAIGAALDFAGGIANAAISLGQDIAGGVADGVNAAADFITGAIQGALDFVGGLANAAVQLGKSIANAIGNAISGAADFITGAIGGAVNAAKGVVGGAVNLGKDIVGGVVNGVKSVGHMAGNAVKSAVTDPVGSAQAAVQFGADMAQGIGNGIKGATDFVANSLKGIPVLGPAAGFVNQGINSAVSFGQDIAGGIADGISSGIGAVGNAVDQVGNVVSSGAGLAGDAFNAGANVAGSVADGVSSGVDAVGSAASDMAGAVADKVPWSPVEEGPLKGLMDSGATIVEMLSQGIHSGKSMLDDTMSTVMGAVDGALDMGGKVANKALTLGEEMAKGMGDGVYNAADRLHGAMNDVAGGALGIAQGIGSAASSAVDSAMGAARGAVEKAGGMIGDVAGSVGGALGGGVGAIGDSIGAVTGSIGGAANMAGNVGGAIAGSVGDAVGGVPGGGQTVQQRNKNQIIFEGEVHDAQKVADMVQDGVGEAVQESQNAVEDAMDMGADVVDEGTDLLGL